MPCLLWQICVRGPILFSGYYKAEQQTRDVMDEDGWFHTGELRKCFQQNDLLVKTFDDSSPQGFSGT